MNIDTNTNSNTNTHTNAHSLSLAACGAGSLWVELWIAKVGPPGVESRQAAIVKISVLTTKVDWKMAQSSQRYKPRTTLCVVTPVFQMYASQGKTLKESDSHYIGVKIKFRQNYNYNFMQWSKVKCYTVRVILYSRPF